MKVEKPTGKILFKEAQRFRQTWLWVLLISSTAVCLIMSIVMAWTDKHVSKLNMFLIVLLAGGIPMINIAAFYFTRLDTVVTDEGIFYRWHPFFRKYTCIGWQDVLEVVVRKYPYFQYGYHRRVGFGRVNNIDGNKGIQLKLTRDRLIYFGSQRIDALAYSIGQVRTVTGEYQ